MAKSNDILRGLSGVPLETDGWIDMQKFTIAYNAHGKMPIFVHTAQNQD